VKENWVKLADDLKNTDTPLDILINCAGILPKFKSGESSNEVEKIFNINFFSQVYSTEAIMPLLNESSHGAIVNIASAAALCPFAGIASYAASKSASERYTTALACESKLFVSCVLPGFVKTDIMKNQGASEKEAKLFYKICADLDKTVKKIMRRLKRGKSRIIVGLDARMMNLLFKLFPKRAPRIITWFLRKTKLEIFKEI
ncbi:MAG: SDR family NAD(P)-dependent oxidoreductase, partial [Clostridia bacterium]|nr:SDR family NAD(P)-dependent oxidoreductase [Clostridia bacterium]